SLLLHLRHRVGERLHVVLDLPVHLGTGTLLLFLLLCHLDSHPGRARFIVHGEHFAGCRAAPAAVRFRGESTLRHHDPPRKPPGREKPPPAPHFAGSRSPRQPISPHPSSTHPGPLPQS